MTDTTDNKALERDTNFRWLAQHAVYQANNHKIIQGIEQQAIENTVEGDKLLSELKGLSRLLKLGRNKLTFILCVLAITTAVVATKLIVGLYLS